MTIALTPPETLIDRLDARRAAEADQARATYRKLLSAGGDTPADVAALEAAARTLNKSGEQMSGDAKALTLARQLRETVQRGRVPQADLQAAAVTLERHQQETLRLNQERIQEHARLLGQQTELCNRVQRGREADAQLARLATMHPDVLDPT